MELIIGIIIGVTTGYLVKSIFTASKIEEIILENQELEDILYNIKNKYNTLKRQLYIEQNLKHLINNDDVTLEEYQLLNEIQQKRNTALENQFNLYSLEQNDKWNLLNRCYVVLRKRIEKEKNND